jgi:cobalt/nickel transport system permease protein
MLNGLLGLILGWAAFPAILVALVLQLLFFGLGGFTVIGVNTLTMALPAVAVHYLFRHAVRSPSEVVALLAGAGAGVLATLLGAVLLSGTFLAIGQGSGSVAQVILALVSSTSPIEGLVTASAVVFLRKVRPELLDAPVFAPMRLEVSDG